MSKCSVVFVPENIQVNVQKGTLLLEAALSAGYIFNNLCGGDGTCKRCKMIVKEGVIKGDFKNYLTENELSINMVLACLSTVESDSVIEIPESFKINKKRPSVSKTLKSSGNDKIKNIIDTKGFILSAIVQKIYIEMDKPTLLNNIPDAQRIKLALKKKSGIDSIDIDISFIKKLPSLLKVSDYKVTITLSNCSEMNRVIDIEPGNTEEKNYIIALDIGTTTLAADLVDLHKNETIDQLTVYNSQGIYGRDVTGRIITSEKKGIEELQKLIIKDITELIDHFQKNNGIKRENIYALVCAGNTVMSHFLYGIPSSTIRRSPYIAPTLEYPVITARELGIVINPEGIIYCIPGISSWVGGDITSGITALNIERSRGLTLFADIGTNGEIVLADNEWMVSCSASAGPALEGANEECGMCADEGAIDRVYIENDTIKYNVIGKQKPSGICGSGIIDLLSVLLKKEIIGRNGRIISLDKRFIKEYNGIKRFILVEGNNTLNGRDIYISESDIENIISAKAAIFAAIRILLKRFDLNFSDIKHFYLAGAFGNYLDVQSAINIGLIPKIDIDKIYFAGNTSLEGAKMTACHEEIRNRLLKISGSTAYYDLMGEEDYVEEFRKAMFLPHTDIELFS